MAAAAAAEPGSRRVASGGGTNAVDWDDAMVGQVSSNGGGG